MMDSLISRQTSLSGNIVQFSRYLRSQGYTISPIEESNALMAMQVIVPDSQHNYQAVLRAIFAKNKYQYQNFDSHYLSFLHEMTKAADSKPKDRQTQKNKPKTTVAPTIEALKSWLYNKPKTDQVDLSSYCNIEVLAKKDFAQMSDDEIRLILATLQELTAKILRKKSRSTIIAKRKGRVDLRLTLRKNLRSGPDIQHIIWSQKKIKRLKMVLLCDVSRSMDLYSKFFIQMMYAFHQSVDKIETFVFSTALHRVTDLLAEHDHDLAFDKIADRVPHWSGGTRIGSCLQTFATDHAYHLLDRKTIVMILSDGWDTGDTSLIQQSMKTIYKSSRRILWLNPLAGHPDFEPSVIGLKSAMPYVHQLYAAHNLESLKNIFYQL